MALHVLLRLTGVILGPPPAIAAHKALILRAAPDNRQNPGRGPPTVTPS